MLVHNNNEYLIRSPNTGEKNKMDNFLNLVSQGFKGKEALV